MSNENKKMNVNFFYFILIILFLQKNSFAESTSFDLSQSINSFSVSLYKELSKDKDSIVVSPFSIHSALTLASFGADKNTANEIDRVLFLDKTDKNLNSKVKALNQSLEVSEDGNELNIANQIFLNSNYKLLDTYLELVSSIFNISPKSLDFINETEASRLFINDWVLNKTNKRIINLIPEGLLSPLTRAVIVNAVYFKADWESPFNRSETKKEMFKTYSNSDFEIDFLNKTNNAKYIENSTYQYLEIPYKGNKFTLAIILPRDQKTFKEVEGNLNNDFISSLNNESQTHLVKFSIPKFKLDYSKSLSSILKKMGMPSAFTANLADFSKMTLEKDLYISEVLHKAFIEIDEKGSEAAAATAVMMTRKSAPMKFEIPKVFNANRPFIFFIKEENEKTMLFLGRFS